MIEENKLNEAMHIFSKIIEREPLHERGIYNKFLEIFIASFLFF